MNKNILKDFLLYGSGSIIVKLLSFLLLPLITSKFTIAEYGVINTVNTLLPIGILCIGLGYDISLKKILMIDVNDVESEDYIFTSLLFLSVWGIFLTGLLISLSKPISYLMFGTQDYFKAISFIFAISFCNVLIGFVLNLLRINFKTIKYSVVSIVKAVLEYCIILLVLIFRPSEIDNYFLAMLVSNIVFVVCLYMINNQFYKGTFKKEYLKKMLAFGLPAVVSSIGYWIFDMSDRLIIVQLTGGTTQTAIYSMAIKMISVYIFLIETFKRTIIPRAFEMYKTNKDMFESTLDKLHTYFMVIFSYFAILNYIFIRIMLKIFVRGDYDYSMIIAIPLILAYVFYSMTPVAAIGIYITNNTKKLASTVWIAALINIAINVIFIPKIGAVAAGISTLCSYLFLYILYWYISQKYMGWNLNMTKPIFSTLLCGIFIVAFGFFQIPNIYIDLVVKLLLSVLYLLLVSAFKIIDIKSVKKTVLNLMSSKSN